MESPGVLIPESWFYHRLNQDSGIKDIFLQREQILFSSAVF